MSLTLPAEDRRFALDPAIGEWSRNDPEEAADWVSGSDESVRDVAVDL